jgi:hypothetical protein
MGVARDQDARSREGSLGAAAGWIEHADALALAGRFQGAGQAHHSGAGDGEIEIAVHGRDQKPLSAAEARARSAKKWIWLRTELWKSATPRDSFSEWALV